MTREQAKELLPIMQAFADGKTIQVLANDTWQDEEYPSFGELSLFRIKPEPEYRPFKTQEECWNEIMKHQPFGWLKSKKDGRRRCIGEVSWSDEFESVYIALSTRESLSRSANSVFNAYTFADGAQFGVVEE